MTRSRRGQLKKYEKMEKHSGMKEQLEQKLWTVKTKVGLVEIGALGAVNPKLEDWLQQIPGATSNVEGGLLTLVGGGSGCQCHL